MISPQEANSIITTLQAQGDTLYQQVTVKDTYKELVPFMRTQQKLLTLRSYSQNAYFVCLYPINSHFN